MPKLQSQYIFRVVVHRAGGSTSAWSIIADSDDQAREHAIALDTQADERAVKNLQAQGVDLGEPDPIAYCEITMERSLESVHQARRASAK